MIIFLYGPDTFRSMEKLKELKEKFKQEVAGGSLNLAEIDGEKLTFAEFKKEVNTVSFMAKRRMIVARNIMAKGSKELQKEIINFLKARKDDEDNILIFWEEESGKQLLFDFLIKVKLIKQEFRLLNGFELKEWVKNAVGKKGGKIEAESVAMLAERIGADLWQMNNELDKLISFSSNISLKSISQMVKTKDDENIFNLTDAVGNKNKKKALKLVDEQLRAGANINYILTMLARQGRILLEIKDYFHRNGNNNSLQNLPKALKLHPFAAKKFIAQEKLYTTAELKKLYGKILEIDLKTKTSSLDAETLLDLLIVS